MNIQILGSGCPKCKTLEANAREAVADLKIDAVITKITGIDEIMGFGVMMTPALAIDNEVKSSGKLLSREQIIAILKDAIA